MHAGGWGDRAQGSGPWVSYQPHVHASMHCRCKRTAAQGTGYQGTGRQGTERQGTGRQGPG